MFTAETTRVSLSELRATAVPDIETTKPAIASSQATGFATADVEANFLMHCDFNFVVAPSSLARLILPRATISCVTALLGISVSERPHGFHRKLSLGRDRVKLPASSRLPPSFLPSSLHSIFLRSLVFLGQSLLSDQIRSLRLVYSTTFSVLCISIHTITMKLTNMSFSLIRIIRVMQGFFALLVLALSAYGEDLLLAQKPRLTRSLTTQQSPTGTTPPRPSPHPHKSISSSSAPSGLPSRWFASKSSHASCRAVRARPLPVLPPPLPPFPFSSPPLPSSPHKQLT